MFANQSQRAKAAGRLRAMSDMPFDVNETDDNVLFGNAILACKGNIDGCAPPLRATALLALTRAAGGRT